MSWHERAGQVEQLLGWPETAADGGDPQRRAVIDLMVSEPDARARWELLRSGGSSLPSDLPGQLDPAAWLGPGHGAQAVEALGRGDRAILTEAAARLTARWAVVLGRPGPVPGVEDALGMDAEVIPWTEGLDHPDGHRLRQALSELLGAAAAAGEPVSGAAAEEGARWALGVAQEIVVRALASRLAAVAPEGGPGRLLLAATGEGLPLLLRALAADMGLRDRVLGVLSVGGAVLGWPGRPGPTGEAACRDWMAANFRHELLDNEVLVPVPYACLQWLDLDAPSLGAAQLPAAHARFPTPGFVGGGRFLQPRESESVDVVDLGGILADGAPGAVVVDVARLLLSLHALARQ